MAFSRYVLRALELVQRGIPDPELVVNDDVELVNLEHVLPKNARLQEWPTFSVEEVELYVDRLGNQCLLQKGPNGRIGNKAWTVKKPVLAASELRLTSSVGARPSWTKREIEMRQETLADLALRAWPRDPR